MNRIKSVAWVAAVAALTMAGSSGIAGAQTDGRSVDVSLMGGAQLLSKNDTAFPDRLINVPLIASVAYQLDRHWAIESELAWMIPVERNIDMGTGPTQDRKSPDVLAYQAGVRAALPRANWTPYLAAGAGAVTFLSSTDANRVPQLSESQTAFAVNFGGGSIYNLGSSRWTMRADVRELVAFPSNDAQGLSTAGEADPVWMGRATVGLGYRF